MLQFLLILYHIFSFTSAESCNCGDIRLGNSTNGLELCNATTEKWDAMCGFIFYCDEAKVACRQAGYSDVLSYRRFTIWPEKKTNLGLYSCSGYETSFLSCPPYTYWRNRKHNYCDTYRVSVKCANSSGEKCSTESAIRLVGGSSESEGQLQICKNNIWRDVCQNNHRYLQNLGTIVCKQLGYTDPYFSVANSGHFYNSTDREYYSRVNCYGSTYADISQCYTYSDCIQCKGREVSIKCEHELTDCKNGSVRLVGGPNDVEGSLEICLNGIWGGFSHNIEGDTKELACAALGFSKIGATIIKYHNYKNSHVPLLIQHINCCNEDKKLLDCDITCVDYTSGSFENTRIAGLRCTDGCTNGQMRLVGGQTSNEGVVEVCSDATWTYAALDSWDNHDAAVVCGYTDPNKRDSYPLAMNSSSFEKGNRPVRYRYYCSGSERSLMNCGKSWHYQTENELVAAVHCGYKCGSTEEGTDDRRKRQTTDDANSQKENGYASGENHVVMFSALGLFAGGSIFGILVGLSLVQVTKTILKKKK